MSIKIALAGNPNCGKTTMFNELTGASQYVGNWPGVTVEKKEGKLRKKHKGEADKSTEIIITDLPGIYSLSPYTLEEVVSRDYLINDKPDCIIDLVDATNLERNFYLTTQLMELGIPVVVALNMYDVIEKSGDKIDVKKLSEKMGCPIVPTSAVKGEGLKELLSVAIKAAKENKAQNYCTFSEVVEGALSEISGLISGKVPEELLRWHSVKLFERDSKEAESLKLDQGVKDKIEAVIKATEKEKEDDALSIITDERYNYITGRVQSAVKKPKEKMNFSDRIDKIVTNRFLGLPIFILVMYAVYYITINLGTIVTDWTNDILVAEIVQENVRTFLEKAGANPTLIALLVDGAIAGVGAVIGFMPQMAILFVLMSILEDIGYMARIAFVMDRVFRFFGLSGKSIIPLLISSGCGIPGIMATKTIENDNDRRLTIFTTTSVPCGAKLPVISLIAGVALKGGAFMTFMMYVTGVLAVLISSIILKKFKSFHGLAAPFVMELPAYHIPKIKTVVIHVWDRLKGFFIKAGTIIFLASIIMWFLQGYGFSKVETENGSEVAFGEVAIEDSLLAKVGGAIAPVFRPLGFDRYEAVSATFTGLVAKEMIVGTMAVLGNADTINVPKEEPETEEVMAEPAEAEAEAEEHDFEDPEDPKNVAAAKSFLPSPLIALSFLIFNLLCSPCLAAVGTMAKELKDRKMFWFGVLWQNGFAYAMTFLVYQFGLFITEKNFTISTGVAFVVLAGVLFLLLRRDPYKADKTVRRSVAEA